MDRLIKVNVKSNKQIKERVTAERSPAAELDLRFECLHPTGEAEGRYLPRLSVRLLIRNKKKKCREIFCGTQWSMDGTNISLQVVVASSSNEFTRPFWMQHCDSYSYSTRITSPFSISIFKILASRRRQLQKKEKGCGAERQKALFLYAHHKMAYIIIRRACFLMA